MLHTTLDTKAKVLRDDEVITYTNNSPDALPSLWLHMKQNIYRKDSRARRANGGQPRRRPGKSKQATEENQSTEGFVIGSVEVEVGKTSYKAETLTADTRMQVRLRKPLPPKGVLKLHIRYHYTIPGV